MIGIAAHKSAGAALRFIGGIFPVAQVRGVTENQTVTIVPVTRLG